MHPLDVADLISEEVERLAQEIAARPELRAEAPLLKLAPQPVITITVTKVERPLIGAQMPMGLLGPGGREMIRNVGAIDLSRHSERQLILQLGCDRYDGLPPTAELLGPDRDPLPAVAWPTDPSGQGIIDGHPDYQRKFFCRRGLREFHTHPQHEDEPWDMYRETLLLHEIVLGLLHDLQHRFIAST